MILCPNHTRKKRPHRGGGTPGCRSPLHVKMDIALDFRACRWPKMLSHSSDFDRVLNYNLRKFGRRVLPRDLFESFTRGKWDLVCPTCGFSYRKSLNALNDASKRQRKF